MPNYCADCGRHLVVPATDPEVARTSALAIWKQVACSQCPRRPYIQDNRISQGETTVIPQGGIALSLKPDTASEFTRPGVTWFAHNLMGGNIRVGSSDIEQSLASLEAEGIAALSKVPELRAILEGDQSQLQEAMVGRRDTPPWWAYTMIASSVLAQRAVKDGNVMDALTAGFLAARSKCFLEYDQHLDELVWSGYSNARRQLADLRLQENRQQSNDKHDIRLASLVARVQKYDSHSLEAIRATPGRLAALGEKFDCDTPAVERVIEATLRDRSAEAANKLAEERSRTAHEQNLAVERERGRSSLRVGIVSALAGVLVGVLGTLGVLGAAWLKTDERDAAGSTANRGGRVQRSADKAPPIGQQADSGAE